MDQLYNFLGWEELPGTRDELEVLRIWIDELAQKNLKFQAPNLRILGVPPEADQVSGKKTKKLKPWSLRFGIWDFSSSRCIQPTHV
jgi:hypothetical protein